MVVARRGADRSGELLPEPVTSDEDVDRRSAVVPREGGAQSVVLGRQVGATDPGRAAQHQGALLGRGRGDRRLGRTGHHLLAVGEQPDRERDSDQGRHGRGEAQ